MNSESKKKFIENLLNKGKNIEEITFIIGFKAAIDCLESDNFTSPVEHLKQVLEKLKND